MPSQWHEWKVLSPEVGEINKSGVFYAKDKLASTKIEVWDIRNEGEISLERQNTHVEVAEAWNLTIESLDCGAKLSA